VVAKKLLESFWQEGLLMIKNVKNLVRSCLDFFIIGYGFLVYKIKGKTPQWAYFALIRMFCFSSGYSNDFLSFLIGLVRRPYHLGSTDGLIGKNRSVQDGAALSNLRKNGYCVLPALVNPEVCDKLLKIANSEICHAYIDGEKVLSVKFNPKNPIAVKYQVPSSTLINKEVVQEIISDASIIDLVQKYLGSAPVLDTVNMWWTTAINKDPDSHAAQLFHFDMDKIKWLKLFIYVTDVSEKTGPHTFVSGSHKSGSMPKQLLSKGYARHEDKEILEFYKQSQLKEFCGPKGTVILEDTRGFHKGTPVKEGQRLMFELELSNSLFGGEHPRPELKKIINKKFALALKRYPRLYSNFF
jgi:hypothetical protein